MEQKKIKILTDHQPLTFALSTKNNNTKLKRWKARWEEYHYELIYKPGCTNKVADTLSRLELEVNTLSSTSTIHSAEDGTDLIQYYKAPINVFKNQLIIKKGKNIDCHEEPHSTYHRLYVSLPEINKDTLTKHLMNNLNPTIINGIKIPEEHIQMLQDIFKEQFPGLKLRLTQRVVQDISNEENKFKIITEEHNRAHRNHVKNKQQILERYYFPRMASLIKKYTKTSSICNINKYDRHNTVPTYPTEILHMDIIEIKN